jgi:hypothetical protein
MNFRRSINGLWNMGRPRTPPLPAAIQMQDRASPTTWFQLSHSGTPGSLALDVTQTLWTKPDKVLFAALGGPYLVTGSGWPVRLYVEDGELLGEFYTGPVHSSPRIMTRRGWDRTLLEVTADAGWQPGDPWTLTEINLAAHIG